MDGSGIVEWGDPLVVMHRDCVVCLAEAQPGLSAAIATLSLLKVLQTITIAQVLGDLCFAHRRVLSESREG